MRKYTPDDLERKFASWKIKILRPIYQKYILPRKVKALRKKKIINALFVLHELGAWKTESLYLKMRENSRFDVKILLVPEIRSQYAFHILKKYLDEKQYPYETIKENESIKERFHPDIIFYQKPYNGNIKWHYFYTNNLYALFPYVMYCFRNRNSPHLKNIGLFDFSWQLYAENETVIEELKGILNTKGKNMVNTGLPIMDVLVLDKTKFPNPWKELSGNRKRIIYAPHHTLNTETVKFHSPFYYATFLEYADFMLEMAEKYKDKVQWAFKPHPLLRFKLEKLWGAEKTDSYYKRWADMENSQVDEGEYMGLFKHSDAMIHDCGSFKLEYLYTDNPVMYLIKDNPEYDYENWQTTKALELHYKGTNQYEIEKFIQNVIESIDPLKEERKKFVETYLTPPNGKSACENIINAILGTEEYA